MGVVFALGFVLEFVEIIFIVVPIVAPVLLGGSFDPVWVAVLFALNLQTSFLTPPFGFALFYFRSVAPAGPVDARAVPGGAAVRGAPAPCAMLGRALPALATWLPEALR